MDIKKMQNDIDALAASRKISEPLKYDLTMRLMRAMMERNAIDRDLLLKDIQLEIRWRLDRVVTFNELFNGKKEIPRSPLNRSEPRGRGDKPPRKR